VILVTDFTARVCDCVLSALVVLKFKWLCEQCLIVCWIVICWVIYVVVVCRISFSDIEFGGLL
jgi:hypothetical protein